MVSVLVVEHYRRDPDLRKPFILNPLFYPWNRTDSFETLEGAKEYVRSLIEEEYAKEAEDDETGPWELDEVSASEWQLINCVDESAVSFEFSGGR